MKSTSGSQPIVTKIRFAGEEVPREKAGRYESLVREDGLMDVSGGGDGGGGGCYYLGYLGQVCQTPLRLGTCRLAETIKFNKV